MVNSQHDKLKEEFSRAKAYAAEYQGTTPMSHLFNTRLVRVTELLSELKTGKVLDIGCGPAFIGDKFRDGKIEYYGLDLSQHMIEECVNHFGVDPQFHFVLGSIESLPFPDNHFDAVLCLGALEYIRDEQAAFDEITRVLKPQGLFVVTMQNGYSPYRLWQRFVYWKAKNLFQKINNIFSRPKVNTVPKTGGEPRYFKLHPYRELQKLLVNNNLRVKDLLYYDFNLFIPPLDNLFCRMSVFVSRNLEVLARGKLKFLGTGYILKCLNIKEQ